MKRSRWDCLDRPSTPGRMAGSLVLVLPGTFGEPERRPFAQVSDDTRAARTSSKIFSACRGIHHGPRQSARVQVGTVLAPLWLTVRRAAVSTRSIQAWP